MFWWNPVLWCWCTLTTFTRFTLLNDNQSLCNPLFGLHPAITPLKSELNSEILVFNSDKTQKDRSWHCHSIRSSLFFSLISYITYILLSRINYINLDSFMTWTYWTLPWIYSATQLLIEKILSHLCSELPTLFFETDYCFRPRSQIYWHIHCQAPYELCMLRWDHLSFF